MGKQEIIDSALGSLASHLGINAEVHPFDDAEDHLILNINNIQFDYAITIKKQFRIQHINSILEQGNAASVMIVSAHLFPKVKEELRKNNIAYLEANGNIFMKNGNSIIWIDNNKPMKIENAVQTRAFTKTGLKVVFQFLLDETWINISYRQIAQKTGTSIGNVTNIMNGLKHDNFLIPINTKEYRLNNKKVLLDKWVELYALKLKPTLKIGSFRFLKQEDFYGWKNIILENEDTVWGGEPAGELLTDYLRPAELTVYTKGRRNDLIKNYKWIPDDSGNIKVYEKFWNEDDVKGNMAPPLLVYADLINCNDRRCTETAQKIFNEYLQNKF